MRFALRNQDKIAARFGDDYLQDHILASLKSFFKSVTEEELSDFVEQYSDDAYARLRINDVADDDDMQEFYIIGREYDVLRLAYSGRIKG